MRAMAALRLVAAAARRRVTMLLLGASMAACAPAGRPLTPPTPLPLRTLPAGIAEIRLPADATTLRSVNDEDDAAGRLDRRREVVATLNRQLLMPPPDDHLVPELFDLVVALAPQMEAGVVSPAWGSHLFTTYQRELAAERPDGTPRRSTADIDRIIVEWKAFYALRSDPRRGGDAATPAAARPDAPSPASPTPEDAGFELLRRYRDERRQAR
jgi:hypothetical protein